MLLYFFLSCRGIVRVDAADANDCTAADSRADSRAHARAHARLCPNAKACADARAHARAYAPMPMPAPMHAPMQAPMPANAMPADARRCPCPPPRPAAPTI